MPKQNKADDGPGAQKSPESLKSLPLSAIIRAFNEDLVDSFSEEERIVSWEESGGDDSSDSPKGGGGGKGGGHIIRLDKELHMARLILLEKTRSGDDKLDPKFLISLVKLLSKSEKAVGWYGDRLRLWKRFLSILVDKMKQEPLEVYSKKPANPAPAITEKKVVMDFGKPAGEGRQ